MKIIFKIILGFLAGAILGAIFPYAISFLNLFPFLRSDTPYEIVMDYMLFSAIECALIGGSIAYRWAKLKYAT